MADVKKEEKQAESASAKATADKKEAEEASEAMSPEAEGEVGKTPAEVEAINTDNETAKEVTEASAKSAPTPDESESRPESVGKEKKPAPTGKPALPAGRFKDLIKDIEGLTTVELAELVKALEERFGVSAAAPMAMGAPSAGSAVAGPEAAEEKAMYTVVLADSGAQKIAVIKALREINQELGLKDAKDIADAPPKEILKDAPKEKAEEAKKKLEAAGAKVELK